MNKVLAFEICSELNEDREFALRFQGLGSLDVLTTYFTARGIDAGDAMVLASAYLAGSRHAGIFLERTVDRVEGRRP